MAAKKSEIVFLHDFDGNFGETDAHVATWLPKGSRQVCVSLAFVYIFDPFPSMREYIENLVDGTVTIASNKSVANAARWQFDEGYDVRIVSSRKRDLKSVKKVLKNENLEHLPVELVGDNKMAWMREFEQKNPDIGTVLSDDSYREAWTSVKVFGPHNPQVVLTLNGHNSFSVRRPPVFTASLEDDGTLLYKAMRKNAMAHLSGHFENLQRDKATLAAVHGTVSVSQPVRLK
jgi:hypothetical protein